MQILRLRDVMRRTGYTRATLYNRVADGTLPQPVPLGGRVVGWPDTEIDAIIRARVAGQSDDEIRTLVRDLIASRSMQAAA